MRTRAAVLWEVGKDWQVQDVDLDPPAAGEVLVELAASGLCHSDEHLVTGDLPFQLPIIGGHEGAGVVQEVGPGVTTVRPGDHVVLGFVPSCGRCPPCSTGHQNLCDLGAYLGTGRQISDGTARHHTPEGEDLGLMCLLGTFSPFTVVNEASCIKVTDDIPLDKACLVGCGVTTGWGAAVYTADVRPGEAVVVVGIGGIGASALQGAVMAGARFVVAVDPVAFKRDQALALGATHVAASIEEAVALVRDITWGRKAEKVILTPGVVRGEMIGPIMGGMVAKGGRCVVTGLAPALAMDVQLNLADLTLQQKQLVGSIFGGGNPRYDIPRLLRLYVEGKLKIDEMITRTYALDEVNDGYQAMRDAENVRGVLVF